MPIHSPANTIPVNSDLQAMFVVMLFGFIFLLLSQHLSSVRTTFLASQAIRINYLSLSPTLTMLEIVPDNCADEVLYAKGECNLFGPASINRSRVRSGICDSTSLVRRCMSLYQSAYVQWSIIIWLSTLSSKEKLPAIRGKARSPFLPKRLDHFLATGQLTHCYATVRLTTGEHFVKTTRSRCSFFAWVLKMAEAARGPAAR